MDDGEPKTCALSNGTCGKERLKYTLDGSRVHSSSRIANPEFNARLRYPTFVGMFLISQTNYQHAFRALHCLISVREQVHQQMRRERSIRSHEWKRFINLGPYLDGRLGEHRKKV